VISEPFTGESRIHGFPCTCTFGLPRSREAYAELVAWQPERFPPWSDSNSTHPPLCSETFTYVRADVRCNCGIEIKNLLISGDWYQWIACRTCYRSMHHAIQNAYREAA
jgi:hypothetical protein